MEGLIFFQTFGNGLAGFVDSDTIVSEDLGQPLGELGRVS